MPTYPQYDLMHQYISQSYVRILQVIPSGEILDGNGTSVELTSSVSSASYALFAEHAVSASYAFSSSVQNIINVTTYAVHADTATTASYALNTSADHALLTHLDYASSGHVGFAGTTIVNQFKQDQVITGSLNVVGHLFATQKSFYINDLDNPGKHLIYGALEGPQNDVFIRGHVVADSQTVKILLPIEWKWLVNEDTITIQLTQRTFPQTLLVSAVKENYIVVKNTTASKKSKKELDFDYLIIAERKDVDKLQVRD